MSTLRPQLESLADPDYREFSARLLPPGTPLLGVRLPALRKLARRLAKDGWRTYLEEEADDTFEEILLQGMVIGCADVPTAERQALTAAFVPKIGNWSVCDSFCAGLKAVREDPDSWWTFLMPYVTDTEEYAVRFGVVMLLFYYIDEAHLPAVLALLGQADCQGPAARTAVSWAAAECCIRFPEPTEAFFADGRLAPSPLRGALQKLVESHRVGEADKARYRAMRSAIPL